MAAPPQPCRLGVNGFGRIGRLVVRAALRTPGAECVCINDPLLDVSQAAYLFCHDTVHGRYEGTGATHARACNARDARARAERRCAVEADAKGGAIVVDGRRIAFSAERDPTKIRWADARATHVVECSGVFVDGAAAAGHLTGGARKVIISAPAKDDATPTLLMGVNHESYDPKARARRMRCACARARIRAAERMRCVCDVRCASSRACTSCPTPPAPPTAWRRSPRHVAPRRVALHAACVLFVVA
jgi:glyceraldehyde-3-phosphate dehydrogenase/erythrose-4-phosphate dehydrogenase